MKPNNNNNKFGTCLKYPKHEINKIDYLVSGIKEPPQYWFCSIVRNYDNMCGPKGKYYVRIKNTDVK
jgi:hypothetical protein